MEHEIKEYQEAMSDYLIASRNETSAILDKKKKRQRVVLAKEAMRAKERELLEPVFN